MATSNYIKLLLKISRYYSQKSQTKGFTLLELLMAIMVSGIVVYAMLSLVVSLVGTDQKETAKSETQVEISQAMDYMAREVEQAIYIYPGDCLGTDNKETDRGDDYNCQGLSNQIDFADAGVTPVLAFWKPEEVKEYDDNLPENCDGFSDEEKEECLSLLTSRHSSTLVVYSRQEIADDDTIWNGPYLIRRFQLRKYENVANLEKTEGYSDPGTAFGTWESTQLINIENHPALVDSVDDDIALDEDDEFNQDCPEGYTKSANSMNSFFACVSNPSAGSAQDAIVYLRGNATKRAGYTGSLDPGFFPSIKRQVKARSVLNYTPPDL